MENVIDRQDGHGFDMKKAAADMKSDVILAKVKIPGAGKCVVDDIVPLEFGRTKLIVTINDDKKKEIVVGCQCGIVNNVAGEVVFYLNTIYPSGIDMTDICAVGLCGELVEIASRSGVFSA